MQELKRKKKSPLENALKISCKQAESFHVRRVKENGKDRRGR